MKTVVPVGQRFGKLMVLADAGRNANNYLRYVLVRCECGQEARVRLTHLKQGRTTSCGCSRQKHGAAKIRTAEYNAWVAMVQRCRNPKNPRWADYGGRGITVCQAWVDSFEVFLRDMGPRPTARHSIDRIDNSLGYTPENCRWATPAEQVANRRPQRRRRDAGTKRGPRRQS